MPDVPETVNFPATLDSTVSLIVATNNAATALSSNASPSDATLTVDPTASFASSGAISIEGEVIFYTAQSVRPSPVVCMVRMVLLPLPTPVA